MNLPLLIEAILFSSDEPVSLSRLTEALETSESEILSAVASLERTYSDRGVALKRVSGGFMFVTRPEFADLIEKTLSKKVPLSLSKGTMETLAIVAYKQPVTRQDIESVRGVNPEASIETLLEKGLIREVGRKKTLGRPKLYGTTDEFLRKAGLNALTDLPPLDGPDAEAGAKLLPDPPEAT
ncbi:MAG: SMC-Scp complex subunit ScpB [Bacillota bacterium]